ncbi:MAG: metallophosphoesterase [Massilibacteroides sp.]|nr:metallophosphoesterase [Massilibacteroides sp.]
MPIVFFVILGLYLAGNFYIYFKGIHVLAAFPVGIKVGVSLLFWFFTLALLFTFLLRKSNVSLKLLTFLHEAGSVWLVFSLYMVLFLLFFDLLRCIYKPFSLGFYGAFGLTLCLLLYGYYNYKHPEIREYTITVKKSMPVSSLKIVAVSDVHLGLGTGKRALTGYIDRINVQRPDIILISGDLIDNSVLPLKQERMEEELNRLSAPLGVYMVPGNHEYIAEIEECVDFIRSTQIQLLRDSVVSLENGLQLIGRDDRSNHCRKTLSELLKKTVLEKPMILLDHQPYNLDRTVSAGVDLQFSGHTHRGQIWPLSWLTDRLFELSYGYERRGETSLYVSSGLSLWGPPFRIGTDSELVVFNLIFQ